VVQGGERPAYVHGVHPHQFGQIVAGRGTSPVRAMRMRNSSELFGRICHTVAHRSADQRHKRNRLTSRSICSLATLVFDRSAITVTALPEVGAVWRKTGRATGCRMLPLATAPGHDRRRRIGQLVCSTTKNGHVTGFRITD
jgi:hypothetical protein